MVTMRAEDVFEQNLESADNSVDNYRSVESEVEALAALLLYDLKRFMALVPDMTPGRLAKIAGLSSDWTIRDIRKPDWYVKNIATLFRLERAVCTHPAWRPKRVFGRRSIQTSNGFIYRRWVDPLASHEFGRDTLLWETRSSDAAFVEAALKDPWMSTIDVSTGDPFAFRVLRYAPGMIETYGLDKSGMLVIENPSPDYGRFVAADLLNCLDNKEARSRDMFHSFKRLSDRIVFRNATWPCPQAGVLVSKIQVEYWRPGAERLVVRPPYGPPGSSATPLPGSSS